MAVPSPRRTRPEVPQPWLDRLHELLSQFPRCASEDSWAGVRWRVSGRTVAHAFGGHDQRFRITFRADPDEVMAFRHLGEPYFVVGGDAVGLMLDEETDWVELGELLTDSYCRQAPATLAEQVDRPPR